MNPFNYEGFYKPNEACARCDALTVSGYSLCDPCFELAQIEGRIQSTAEEAERLYHEHHAIGDAEPPVGWGEARESLLRTMQIAKRDYSKLNYAPELRGFNSPPRIAWLREWDKRANVKGEGENE